MKKIISIVTTMLLISVMLMGCGTAKALEFTTFTNEAGGFSVDMPGEPEENSQTIPTAIGDMELKIYMVEEKEYAFAVTVTDIPAELLAIEGADVAMLENGASGAVMGVNGKNDEITDAAFGEYPGKEIKCEIDLDGTKGIYHQKIYLVDNKLYQLAYTHAESFDNSEDEAKFFDSFKLLEK